jgi:pteridine reductase
MTAKVVLITGAGRRLGAQITQSFHSRGYHVLMHYRSSVAEAQLIASSLNAARPDSVHLCRADLLDTPALPSLIDEAAAVWGRLDVLVNNAASFYPTSFGTVTGKQWDDLLDTNLKAPFFLAQAAAPQLRRWEGCIVNIVDIHAERGLQGYTAYSISKAGLAAMTRFLAKDLAPEVRVNGVAPGAILWPEGNEETTERAEILSRIPLQRTGDPEDVARTVVFLADDAPYITGQILAVDGGRSLYA